MSNRTYRVTEIVGTSPEGSTRPSATASSGPPAPCATSTGSRSPRSAEQVKDGAVEHFQVGIKVGFRLEDD